jgi:hypothetical protein
MFGREEAMQTDEQFENAKLLRPESDSQTPKQPRQRDGTEKGRNGREVVSQTMGSKSRKVTNNLRTQMSRNSKTENQIRI